MPQFPDSQTRKIRGAQGFRRSASEGDSPYQVALFSSLLGSDSERVMACSTLFVYDARSWKIRNASKRSMSLPYRSGIPTATHSKTIGHLLWILSFTGSHRFYYGNPLRKEVQDDGERVRFRAESAELGGRFLRVVNRSD